MGPQIEAVVDDIGQLRGKRGIAAPNNGKLDTSQSRQERAMPASGWRAMTETDLPDVERVGDIVHPDYPEHPSVFAERLHLYPSGCFVFDGESGIQGYAVSHPWLFGQPPKLNLQLGSIPADADTYYIHDVALLPALRKTGTGTEIVSRLLGHAERRLLASLTLVAVSGSMGFWQKHGFAPVHHTAEHETRLHYGDAAHFMARWLR
jgi:GNAT superfamily N-acetyltransferase